MLSGTSCEWCSGLKGGGWGPLSRLLEGSSRSEFLFSLNLQGRGWGLSGVPVHRRKGGSFMVRGFVG